MPDSSARILLIGYGNTVRGDDSIGPRVAESLLEELVEPRLEILVLASLTPELAERLSQVDSVCFVDATLTQAPGVIEHRNLAPEPNPDLAQLHFLSPETLLTMTERLYGRSPRATGWFVGVESTELGFELTPKVAACLPDLVARIRAHLNRELASLTPRNLSLSQTP